jgi:hypothetical protein
MVRHPDFTLDPANDNGVTWGHLLGSKRRWQQAHDYLQEYRMYLQSGVPAD